MEKSVLKNVLSGLSIGQKIEFSFSEKKAELSGEYSLVGTRRGRGKGGVLLCELRSTNSANTVVVGTSASDDIINIKVNGVLHGYESAEQLPVIYKSDATKAIDFKKMFKLQLVNSTITNPIKIKVNAPNNPEINGIYNVVSCVPARGRVGQMVLNTLEGVQIWSHRHSGAIESIELI